MKQNIRIIAILILGILANKIHAQQAHSLNFDTSKYEIQTLTLNDKSFKVRAFEKIVYLQHPVDTNYQVMNIYIPEAYFEGKTINGYSAATAPIFFPNQVGGYMPAKPASTKATGMGGGMPPMDGRMPQGMPPMPNGAGPMGGGKKQSTVLVALSKGYIVASAGARGRTTKDAQGIYTGKAPAGIVDLKAAIRYLKFNDATMLGNANKIISNGTSAGGAMSTLLGATGNNADYEPYLKALGAAKATDDIYAVSAYCPITNLDNADAAYEWQFTGVNAFKRNMMPSMDNTAKKADGGNVLTAEQIAVSDKLKDLFPEYINSLKLKNSKGEVLTLDASGNGSFKALVKFYVIASAQKALDAGTNLTALTWLTIKDNKVVDLDFDAYVRYMERMKTPPAFDALDLSAGENQLFGTAQIDKQHFTALAVKNSTVSASVVDTKTVKMMNPMQYIGKANTKTAKYWRIRHGSKDKDTGLAIPVVLATYLANKGYVVDFALPWDKTHSGDYDLDELFTWIDSICK